MNAEHLKRVIAGLRQWQTEDAPHLTPYWTNGMFQNDVRDMIEVLTETLDNGGRTGSPPGLLQDDSRELSRALASKPDARMHAREAAKAPPMPSREELFGLIIKVMHGRVDLTAVTDAVNALLMDQFSGERHLSVVSRHIEDYVLINEKDGTRWRGTREGRWVAEP